MSPMGVITASGSGTQSVAINFALHAHRPVKSKANFFLQINTVSKQKKIIGSAYYYPNKPAKRKRKKNLERGLFHKLLPPVEMEYPLLSEAELKKIFNFLKKQKNKIKTLNAEISFRKKYKFK